MVIVVLRVLVVYGDCGGVWYGFGLGFFCVCWWSGVGVVVCFIVFFEFFGIESV